MLAGILVIFWCLWAYSCLGGFSGGFVIKNPPANAGECWRRGFNPWVKKIPWRRKWQPTPVFLPGGFYGQKSLAGYSPYGPKESDRTEQLTPLAERHGAPYKWILPLVSYFHSVFLLVVNFYFTGLSWVGLSFVLWKFSDEWVYLSFLSSSCLGILHLPPPRPLGFSWIKTRFQFLDWRSLTLEENYKVYSRAEDDLLPPTIFWKHIDNGYNHWQWPQYFVARYPDTQLPDTPVSLGRLPS